MNLKEEWIEWLEESWWNIKAQVLKANILANTSEIQI